MSRPNTQNLVIELPQFDSPVTGVGICGTSYRDRVVVRVPHGNVDSHEGVLQPLMSSPPTTNTQLTVIALAIASAQSTIDGNNAQVPVRLTSIGGPDTATSITVADQVNRQAIRNLIDRATYYLEWARALWNYWARDWRPTVIDFVKWKAGRHPSLASVERGLSVRWPLDVQGVWDIPQSGWEVPYGTRCWEARTSGETSIIMDDTPTAGWAVRVACPTAAQNQQHAADRTLFRELAEAALLWARCAQEAAYAVGVQHLNKRDSDTPQPINGFAPLPPEPEIPIGVIFDPGTLDVDLPPPPIPPEGAPDGVPFTQERAPRKKPVPWGKVALGGAAAYVAWRVLAT